MNKVVNGLNKVTGQIRHFGFNPLGLLGVIVLVVAPLIVNDEFITRLLITSLLFGSLAMAFDFTAGFINITNFGFAAFWGAGAYTSALLVVKLGWSPWLGMLAAGLLAGLLGFALGVLTLRLSGIFAACMTWFVALALMSVAANWVSLTKGNSGLGVPSLLDSAANLPYYYVMLFITIVTYVILLTVSNSYIGMAFRAIGQNLQAAQASGIDVTKFKIINFTISCAVAGVIGGFYAHYIGILTPGVMSTTQTVEMMVIAFVGGRGSIWGSLIAALILIPTMEYLNGLMEFRLLIYGLLMIFVMIFYPGGLAGILRKLESLLLRQKSTLNNTNI